MTISRRSLLYHIGRIAGAGATFAAMNTMGLVAPSQASPLPPLAQDAGKGRRVLVLGAGIAGLSAAMELQKAGFDVIVIEAAKRPGGRNWTIRGGTNVALVDGSVQPCTWQEGNYLNAGPARIPSIHRNLLAYCKALKVPLEVEVNSSRSGLLQADTFNGGVPVEQRQAVNDTRGFVSELLAKAINRKALDDSLSPDEISALLPFLRTYGDLDDSYHFVGSRRSGYAVPPMAGPGHWEVRKPLNFPELVKANFLRGMMYEEHLDWQATMLQPVGGMDQIAYAMAKTLGDKLLYDMPVTELQRTADGVRIRCGTDARARTFDAEFAICAIPGQILKSLAADFSPATRSALQTVTGDAHFKTAWESERFWETDDHLYGGLSFLNDPLIDTVWYPSGRMQGDTGIIISGFGMEIDDQGKTTAFGKLDRNGKLAASRKAVEKLHPGRSSQLRNPIHLPWHQVPHMLGALSMIAPAQAEQTYQQLNEPDGPFYFAGDWLSRLNGWQEGAILSGHRAVAAIAARTKG